LSSGDLWIWRLDLFSLTFGYCGLVAGGWMRVGFTIRSIRGGCTICW
jgi:hypothetical protein